MQSATQFSIRPRNICCLALLVATFCACGQEIDYQLPTRINDIEEADTDLQTARSNYKTKLRLKIAAPQSGDEDLLPPDPSADRITYASGDLQLAAWISKPPHDKERHPAVVFLHGGYTLGASDWTETQPFREAGFVVMTPSLRGENGNPGHFEMFYGEVDDAIAAGRHLAKLPYVDPDRIYVAGHSIGGQLCVLVAQMNSPYRAAAAYSPSAIDVSKWVNALLRSTDPSKRDQIVFDAHNKQELQLRNSESFARFVKIPLILFRESQSVQNWGEFTFAARFAKRPVLEEDVSGDHFTMLAPAIERTVPWLRFLGFIQVEGMTAAGLNQTWRHRETPNPFSLALRKRIHITPKKFKTILQTESFGQITMGMKLPEVEALLGAKPGHYGEFPRAAECEDIVKSLEGVMKKKTWSSKGVTVTAEFRDGKLLGRSMNGRTPEIESKFKSLEAGMAEAEVDRIFSDLTKGIPPNPKIGIRKVWKVGETTLTVEFGLQGAIRKQSVEGDNSSALGQKYKMITNDMTEPYIDTLLADVTHNSPPQVTDILSKRPPVPFSQNLQWLVWTSDQQLIAVRFDALGSVVQSRANPQIRMRKSDHSSPLRKEIIGHVLK